MQSGPITDIPTIVKNGIRNRRLSNSVPTKNEILSLSLSFPPSLPSSLPPSLPPSTPRPYCSAESLDLLSYQGGNHSHE